MGIFRAYDIRGIYGTELTEKMAEDIGKAYATHMNEQRCHVGMDARISSPILRDGLVRGLNDAGCDVIDLGMVPTPALYFALSFYKELCGIMITASHNPKEYNGFKLCKGLRTIGGKELKRVEEISVGGYFRVGHGEHITKDILFAYKEYLLTKFEFEGMKIIIDCMNGVGASVLPEILAKLGNDVTVINAGPDGNFPKHSPNPDKEENLAELKAAVVRQKADIGIALDGDCDRVVFVDEKGETLPSAETAMLFIRDVLSRKRGKIVVDVQTSELAVAEIRDKFGIPIMSKTGHTHIRDELIDKGAIFAAEASGHYYFKDDYFGYDDGIYSALRMCAMAARKGKVSEMRKGIPHWFGVKMDVECRESKKREIMGAMKRKYAAMKPLTIDGLRVSGKDHWFTIRQSNTEPVIKVRGEFLDEKEAKGFEKKVGKELRALVKGA